MTISVYLTLSWDRSVKESLREDKTVEFRWLQLWLLELIFPAVANIICERTPGV